MEAVQDDRKSQRSDRWGRDNAVKIRALKAYSATVKVHINGTAVAMQYDPGAAKSVINKPV